MKKLIILAVLLSAVPALTQTYATLPQASVDTTIPSSITGTTLTATACTGASGTGVQASLDTLAATDGSLVHKLVVTSSLSCPGQFFLRNRTGANPNGTGYIIIETSAVASLPAKGTRVTPSAHLSFMPSFTTNVVNQEGAWLAEPHARHYYFVGIAAEAGTVSATSVLGFGHKLIQVSNVSRVTNAVTLTTSAVHKLLVGDTINLQRFTDTSFNGTFVIATTPSTTQITYTQTAGDASCTSVSLCGANNSVSPQSIPHHLQFNRGIVRGNPAGGGVVSGRCIVTNADNFSITDSYVDLCLHATNEMQVIAGWNFSGPFLIDNNYLGGGSGGEAWLFGGTGPIYPGRVPSDGTITRNYVYWDTAWNAAYAKPKNRGEVKIGQRFLFEGNKFQNYYAAGIGSQFFAFVLTPGNCGSQLTNDCAPQTVVQDMTVRKNWWKDIGGWANHNYSNPSGANTDTGDGVNVICTVGQIPAGCLRTRRFTYQDNLVEGLSGSVWSGYGKALQILGPIRDVVMEHITIAGDGTGTTTRILEPCSLGPPSGQNVFSTGMYFRNNLVYKPASSTIVCTGSTEGYATLNWSATGVYPGTSTVSFATKNVFRGTSSTLYPLNNAFPATAAAVGFVNWQTTGGDYRLCTGAGTPSALCAGASAYVSYATDGLPSGVSNWVTWSAATCGAETGDWSTASGKPCATAGSPAPTISGIAPTSGSYLGGTAVTISGTGFQVGLSTVVIGAAAMTSTVVVNSTTITGNTPARAAGAVDIVVTNPDFQSATLASGYTYTGSGAPTISALATSETNAARGSTFGGYILTVTGTNFAQGATVLVDGQTCGGVVVTGSISITCAPPSRGTPGAVDVLVTNPDTQMVTSVGGFTYTKPVIGRP